MKRPGRKPGVHRLTNIRPGEVSLVPKGANKRKFILVKGADPDGEAPEVEISKEGLPLLEGETVEAFTEALRTALRDLAIYSVANRYVWPRSITASSVVVDTDSKLLQHTYSRDSKGAFTIGDPVEVRQRFVFEPVKKDGGAPAPAPAPAVKGGEDIEAVRGALAVLTQAGLSDVQRKAARATVRGALAKLAAVAGIEQQDPTAALRGLVSVATSAAREAIKRGDDRATRKAGETDSQAAVVADRDARIRKLEGELAQVKGLARRIDLPASSGPSGTGVLKEAGRVTWPRDMAVGV